MRRSHNTLVKIHILDKKGNFLGGTVDLDFRHEIHRDHATHRAVDSIGEIRLRGLPGRRSGFYKVTATAAGFKPQTRLLRLPPNGVETLEFTFSDEPASTSERV